MKKTSKHVVVHQDCRDDFIFKFLNLKNNRVLFYRVISATRKILYNIRYF